MSDIVKKAQAQAALSEGITAFAHDDNGKPSGLWLVDLYSLALYARRRGIEFEQVYSDKVKGGYPSMTDALAAAADALGLSPDPDFLRGGVMLSEEERPGVIEALEWSITQATRIKAVRRARTLQSLLTRLTGGGA